ncbi:uncharacterized protein ACMZJ9_015393 isoform 1-T2 [Mantella aurantiaca]
MEKDKMDLTRRFFGLTLEIIYLLTGEDFVVMRESGERISRRVDRIASDGSDDGHGASSPETASGESLLKLTSKIIHLLTGEVRRFVGHGEGSNEDSQPASSLDGCDDGSSPERCPRPLSSRDSTEEEEEEEEEDCTIQQDNQDDNVFSIKVEDEEEDPDVMGDDRCKEELPPEISTGVCRAGDTEMEDRKSLLDGRRIRAEKSSSQTPSFAHHYPQSIKQEAENFPRGYAEDDFKDRCDDADYYDEVQQYCKQEEEEEEQYGAEEEDGTHEEDSLDDSGHEVATQTDQADEMQIKEEEEPVDITAGYDMNDQDSCDSASASGAGSLPIDEYGQPADKPKQYICSECGKGFSLYSYLTKHQRCHSDEKPFTCIECGKCFRYKPSLVAHQRVHTGEKPFSCSECGKLFVTKFNLKAHAKVHTGEKPVECPACGRCFSNNPALVKHLRIHTGEKPFSCTVCGKVFASRSCLNAHQVIHTGERPYMCAECGKAFANQSNLISHRIIHTGQKPYICPECGRGFANQSNLAKHKMTHTDHKPFVCIECGNVFARKEGLAKHFERIHKKKLEF